MHVFVVEPDVALEAGAKVTIDGSEGHHAVSVRRVAVGEVVDLVDGRGIRATGPVIEVHKRAFTVLLDFVRIESLGSPTVTVVQALLKSDRSERAVELMSELGVDRIVPWQSTRSISVWDEAKRVKGVAKWEMVAREAAKQSRQSRVPEVTALANTADVVKLIESTDAAYVLHEAAPPAQLGDVSSENIVLVVGPEGGLTDDEVETFTNAGAQLLRLGPTVLRGSTAGAVGLAVVFANSPRWKEM